MSKPLRIEYTLKAIADHMGIHYTTVSKIIKTMEENGYLKS